MKRLAWGRRIENSCPDIIFWYSSESVGGWLGILTVS